MFRRITRAERERRAAKAELDSTMQAMRAVDSAFREAQDPFSIEQLTYQHAALMCRCRALLRLLPLLRGQKPKQRRCRQRKSECQQRHDPDVFTLHPSLPFHTARSEAEISRPRSETRPCSARDNTAPP